MKPVELANKSAITILAILLIGSASTAVWASGRGWDFIDGGAYYLSYKDPGDVADIQTSYHIFAGWFFRLLGYNIVGFRLFSWFIVAIAVFVFVLGFLRHIRAIFPVSHSPSTNVAVSSCLFLSSLAVFISAPAALTYNSLNMICMLIAVGMLLSSTGRLVNSSQQIWKAWVEISVACIVTGVGLAIKPSTSLLLFGVILAFCLSSPILPLIFKVRLVAFILVCGSIGVAIIAALLGSWSALAIRLSNLSRIMQNASYKRELMTRLYSDLRDLGNFVWSDLRLPLLVLIVATITIAFKIRKKASARAVANFFVIGICLAWFTTAINERLWQAGHDYFARAAIARFYLEAIAVCAAVLAVVRYSRSKEADAPSSRFALNVHLLLLLTMFVALPFAGSFGTTNPIYLNAAFQATFWTAAIVLILVVLGHMISVPGLISTAMLPIGIFASAQFVNGHVLHPYALRTSLFKQDTPTDIGSPATVLLVDAPTSKFLVEARRSLAMNGFTPGDDIFAFFNMPGVVFALGGRSPVIPWYFGRIYDGDTVEESYMQMAGDERRRHAWIITQADVTVFRNHFVRGGLNFPDGYLLIDKLTNPTDGLEVGIWKPRESSR